MCGIVGMIDNAPVNLKIYDALTVLQHRGQDAAGIATSMGGRLELHKGIGLVKDVFNPNDMIRLNGHFGIGHVRYPTAGCDSPDEAQPFYRSSPCSLALAHNGTLNNTGELKAELSSAEGYAVKTNSDSEILLNVFAQELEATNAGVPTHEAVFAAVAGVHRRCQGAYAVVVLIPGLGVVTFRDPFGIRPVVFGRRTSGDKDAWMVASESVALDVVGYQLERDVAAGEAVIFGEDGSMVSQQCAENPVSNPCLFEYVYMARPDSIIDRVSVYKCRLRMGDKLAAQILRKWPEHHIDVVIPIPDTSRSAAIQVAHHLGVKYREGFIKNRYIGRTFIMPGQEQRKKSVRRKLNAIDLEFRGKNVLLVDDSIVRGTTCSQIVQMARDAGAEKVYFASAAPPVRYPNVYGIDMPAANELIASGRTVEEVSTAIGSDDLIYLDLEELRQSALEGNPDVVDFEDSVFSGRYITGSVSEAYLNALQEMRNDDAKKQQQVQSTLL